MKSTDRTVRKDKYYTIVKAGKMNGLEGINRWIIKNKNQSADIGNFYLLKNT